MEYVLSSKEFGLLSDLIYKVCGIVLNESKKELVKARLSKRLIKTGIRSFGEYYKYVIKNDKNGEELVQLIDSISTNKTDFFREVKHFDYLNSKLLPELILEKQKKRNKTIRVWCAASSSGEEPYSLVITLLNHFNPDDGWNLKFLATDISTKVLQKAINGIYPAGTLRGVSKSILSKHFSKKIVNDTDCFEAKDHMKKLITYRRFNLMTPKFPFKYPFDFIFCRNVMIYFDSETQQQLVSKFYDCLPKGGHLFIGHSETFANRTHLFKYVQPAVYKK